MRTMLVVTAMVSGVVATPVWAMQEDTPRIMRPRPVVMPPPTPAPSTDATEAEPADAPKPALRRMRPPMVPTTADAPDPAAAPPETLRRRPAITATPDTGEAEAAAPVIRRRSATMPVAEPVGEAASPPTLRRRVGTDITPETTVPASEGGPRLGPVAPDPRRRYREPVDATSGSTGPVVAESAGDPSTIIPPAEQTSGVVTGAVTLKRGTFQSMMTTLPAIRQFSGAQLRANPRMMIGRTQVDFTALLGNPKALPNVATQLRSMTDLVVVKYDTIEAREIDRGLIVRSMLTYEVKPGGCSSAANAQRLARAGVNCIKRRTQQQQIADFSNPRAAHYVADPAARAAAVAQFTAQSDQMAAAINADIAAARAGLLDPKLRGQIDAQVGAVTAQRFTALTDDQLADELVNMFEAKVEQVAFVPNKIDLKFIPKEALVNSDYAQKLAAAEAYNKAFEGAAEFALEDKIFLTGFTLGREHEWKQRVETSIKWCLLGCKKTYYAEIGSTFSLGFGLRFPLKFGGTYRFDSAAAVPAQLFPTFEPINGGPADYAKAGLAPAKLFEGKELVAEIKVTAFASAKVPVLGQLGPVSVPLGVDFTEYLPGFLKGGQFDPPTPGTPSDPARQVIEFDLLGGRANFGLVAARVFPAVAITLESDRMALALRGPDGNIVSMIERTPGTPAAMPPVTLPYNSASQASQFTVGEPVYNVGFVITPGINPRLSINLGVWNHDWNFPIDFPQLSIKLPPGGADFACHEGTVCTHAYNYTPQGSVSATESQWRGWGVEFDQKWVPLCSDDMCRNSIKLLRFDVVGIAIDKATPLAGSEGNQMTAKAAQSAQIMVDKSRNRLSADYTKRASQALVKKYAPQCKDLPCVDAVEALGNQMDERAKMVAAENPSRLPAWVALKVAGEFDPEFQQLVSESATRAAGIAAMEKQPKIKPIRLPRQN